MTKLLTGAGPSREPNRRTVLAGMGATALSVGIVTPSFAAGSFVSTVFGGVYEREYRKAIVDPFFEKTGIEVILRLGAPGEWLTNALVNQRNPQIDVLLLPYPDSIKAVLEDIGLELTVEDIPNIGDLYPIWYDQYKHQAVGLDYVSFGIGYRTDAIDNPPQSWADLWKPEYAGKIALPDISSAGVWEMMVVASKLNGGDESDLDIGIAAIEKLKPSVRRFYKSTVESAQLLETGEVPIVAMCTDIRAYGLADAGRPVKFVVPTEGAMVGMVSYHIAKNSQNAELGKQFINYALGKEAQEAFCNGVMAGPTNKLATLSGTAAERVPLLDSLLLFDWKKVVPSMSDYAEKWNRKIGA